MEMNPFISIITVSVNEIKFCWKNKECQFASYMMFIAHLTYEDTDTFKVQQQNK